MPEQDRRSGRSASGLHGILRPGHLRINIIAVIAALGDHYTPDESAIIERMLGEYGGTVPGKQLIGEIGLALAVYRRSLKRDS